MSTSAVAIRPSDVYPLIDTLTNTIHDLLVVTADLSRARRYGVEFRHILSADVLLPQLASTDRRDVSTDATLMRELLGRREAVALLVTPATLAEVLQAATASRSAAPSASRTSLLSQSFYAEWFEHDEPTTGAQALAFDRAVHALCAESASGDPLLARLGHLFAKGRLVSSAGNAVAEMSQYAALQQDYDNWSERGLTAARRNRVAVYNYAVAAALSANTSSPSRELCALVTTSTMQLRLLAQPHYRWSSDPHAGAQPLTLVRTPRQLTLLTRLLSCSVVTEATLHNAMRAARQMCDQLSDLPAFSRPESLATATLLSPRIPVALDAQDGRDLALLLRIQGYREINWT